MAGWPPPEQEHRSGDGAVTPQALAFRLFVVVTAIIVAVFLWVAWSTRQSVLTIDLHKAYNLRRRFFYVLATVLLFGMVLTFPRMPYPAVERPPERIVFVVAKQFAFGISDRPILNDQDWEAATYAEPIQIPAGQLVEFRVTSFDVNHGFAIFNPQGVLLGQTQAMPGYVNRLRMRFDRPGRYDIFCLELCGMGHHRMRGVILVVPAGGGPHTAASAQPPIREVGQP